MKPSFLPALALVLITGIGRAQQFSPAIEDNSFLIEEAFNQEPREVQHIWNYLSLHRVGVMDLSFTQEWPVGSQTHQLSYTIPYFSLSSGAKGIGAILVNYRYQLSDSAGWAWISPRLTVILPSGNRSLGVETGSAGVQASIPVSKRLTDDWIVHLNAGATYLPQVRGSLLRHDLLSFGAGASGIFLASEHFNAMLEMLYNVNSSLVDDRVERRSVFIVSPGLRVAIDIGSLQVVPGIAVPFQFSDGPMDSGVFGYLSFEHPF